MQNDRPRLEAIVNDPGSTASEKAVAQAQLDTLNPKSPITEVEIYAFNACGPLGPNLLRFADAPKISEVTWRDLVRFTDSRDWPGMWDNPDVKHLWIGWVCWGNGGLNFYTNFRQ